MHSEHCIECSKKIIIPNLPVDQKREIRELLRDNKRIFAVKQLVAAAGLSLSVANTLMNHINPDFAHCHHCDFKELKSENCVCPRCNAFNTNWDLR